MLRRIEVKTSEQGRLPFLDEYLDKQTVSDGEAFEILKVNESKKRSGWVVYTDAFMIFAWKSDPICEVLLETVNGLLEKNPSCALYIIIDSESAEGYSLAIDEDETRMWVQSKKNNVLPVYASQQTQQSLPTVKKITKNK